MLMGADLWLRLVDLFFLTFYFVSVKGKVHKVKFAAPRRWLKQREQLTPL